MLIFILVERRAPGDFECTHCDETLLFMIVVTSQRLQKYIQKFI